MRAILLVLMAFIALYADKKEPNPDALLQCNAIFEARKDEIAQNLRTLNEKMQNLEAYKNATQNLLDQKQAKLKEQEDALNARIQEAKQEAQKVAKLQDDRKKAIEALVAKNEALLKEIQTSSNSKVAKSFSGMKDSKAAPIIAELDDAEAATILSSLTAADMAKILAKMDAKRAAELTKIIAKGPPFSNADKPKPKVPAGEPKPEQLEQDQRDFQENGGI
ncbi:MotE family protein [Helicobacter canis]|uniref:MotE family protein n=1 Tax=Helicobacter canis TaxID=29419 RepID=UPI0026EBAFF0|nr:flagellar protein [Helicobacter canis]